ncbi:hypothetical protein ACYSNO_09355 [Enterococcus sp. LJL98]
MTALHDLQTLFAAWDGTFEQAESILAASQPLFSKLEATTLAAKDVPELQHLISEYQKLLRFLQEEKRQVQREAGKLNQANQKVRDYVKFNQSSGYEFYY